MALSRLFVRATASLGIALALTFVLAWTMRPAVVPDDVDAIRLVAVAPAFADGLPCEFRLENTGRRAVLVAPDANAEGVGFDLTILGPDGRAVPLPRVFCCGPMVSGTPDFEALEPGQRSSPLERTHPLRGWRPRSPGRYRFIARYVYTPFDVRWQGLPILGRWCEVDGDKDAALIRRTRAFTRTMDFEIDLP